MRKSTISEAPLLFIDTWGWLCLADAKDPAHAAAEQARQRYAGRGGLVTTDYVLDEMITRLFSKCPFPLARAFSGAVFRSAKEGTLRIERIATDRFQRAYSLRLRYRDKPRISFTDLTSFVVMKELGIRDVLTGDRRFAAAQLGFRVLP